MKKTRPAFKYVDLFAGIGGFHAMLDHAGGKCVFLSEIDDAARRTYCANWVDPLDENDRPIVNHDITEAAPDDGTVDVPEHDVLAAGFPCQPFSKSGRQRGMDEARGTLFWNIASILKQRRPAVVLLENVRNIAGPRHKHEWEVIIRTLRELGYRVSDKPTVFSPHLLHPMLGGTPQIRDRVFILGTYIGPEEVERELREGKHPQPHVKRAPVADWTPDQWRAEWILDEDESIPNLGDYALSSAEEQWVDVWDDLVTSFRDAYGTKLPGFPLWSDHWHPQSDLDDVLFSAYPTWKQEIVSKNVAFYEHNRSLIDGWRERHPEFDGFPPSRRKLEWQAQDSTSLWDTVMHFRPSGIRAKAPTYLPALVAITQTSIYGPRKRRLTPREAARLQGLPPEFRFANKSDKASYKQAGNGVAVGAAWHVFKEHVLAEKDDLPDALVSAVEGREAPLNDIKTPNLLRVPYRPM
ncbi:DNA cytosine methyltransferase [Demequina zhanjiangensis]|uniref:Cytosine-specific methyltransferase n=1 Tax=Demequina zhanjiangensis TaxID=3051659 RepID=A0ABT8G2Z2_9MICO|nr:DNA cytosine methyltransferase [Demequina sp. SYSU T00b26]MDN4473377.1 DNA cytosine methyltransferase [Demequina sp. SYSU T00b26]